MTVGAAAMNRAYGKGKAAEIPSGPRVRPSMAVTTCPACGCPCVMGRVPDCPVECFCHETPLRMFGGPGDLGLDYGGALCS